MSCIAKYAVTVGHCSQIISILHLTFILYKQVTGYTAHTPYTTDVTDLHVAAKAQSECCMKGTDRADASVTETVSVSLEYVLLK